MDGWLTLISLCWRYVEKCWRSPKKEMKPINPYFTYSTYLTSPASVTNASDLFSTHIDQVWSYNPSDIYAMCTQNHVILFVALPLLFSAWMHFVYKLKLTTIFCWQEFEHIYECTNSGLSWYFQVEQAEECFFPDLEILFIINNIFNTTRHKC